MDAVPAPSSSPPALAWSTDNCTIGRAMEVLGEKWTFVVLREVFNGIRRFDDMRRHTGIPRQVLTDRLALLVDQDVLRREPYREAGQRERHEYRLTEKGFALFPVMVAIAQWGDRYLAGPEGPPIEFVHRECGAPVEAHLRCTDGHELDRPRDVVGRPGPGVRPAMTDRPGLTARSADAVAGRSGHLAAPAACDTVAPCRACRQTPFSTSCARSPPRSSPLASDRSPRAR